VSDLVIHNNGASDESQHVHPPPLQTSIERLLSPNNAAILPTPDPNKLAPMPESRIVQIPAATSEGGTVMEGTSEKKTSPSHDDYTSPVFGSNFASLDGPGRRIDGLFQEDATFNIFQPQSMISNPLVGDNFLDTATLDMWSNAPTSMVYVALIFLDFHPHTIFSRFDDWANYLNDVDQLTHHQVQQPSQQPDHNDNRHWDAGYTTSMHYKHPYR
jgi:hypothetical protein